MALEFAHIRESTRKGKKWVATFYDGDKRIQTHFGAAGMDDYTQHRDKERRERYRQRHRNVGNKSSPTTAAALSWYILWGDSTSMLKNLESYRKRFNV